MMYTSLQMKRVAVLYSELSGYMAACLKALKKKYRVEVLVFKWPIATEAPFDEQETFGWIDNLYEKRGFKAEDILGIVSEFEPQGLLIPGWMDPDYLKVARVMKRRGVPVVAGSDTPWTGSIRQRISRRLASWYLHPAIDALWVAGERQRAFARHLGYTNGSCWSGLYACDWDRFANQTYAINSETPHFLYAGRFTGDKGIDVLIEAYNRYRQHVENPWRLVCAGTGDQVSLLDGKKGIVNKGFVQPGLLPALMKDAQAFILPSRKEPWGVVAQEAAASGLPLICSTACGAAVHLLQDRYNGFLFEEGDPEHLSACMAKMSTIAVQNRIDMSRRSFELSKQFTPDRWADTLISGLQSLMHSKTRPARVQVV